MKTTSLQLHSHPESTRAPQSSGCGARVFLGGKFATLMVMWIVTFAGPVLAQGSVCGRVPELQQLSRARANVATLDELRDLRERLPQLEASLASQVADQYFRGNRKGAKESLHCLEKVPESATTLVALQREFLRRTYEQMRSWLSPLLSSFVTASIGRNPQQSTRIVQITSHSLSLETQAGVRAGFHRGNGSVLMNVALLAPDEWYLIMLHELAHGEDDQLARGMRFYSAPENLDMLRDILREEGRSPLSSVSHRDQEFLRAWVTAGLDRGFLAEWRAWTATISLYCEGRRQKYLPRVNWLEAVLQRSRELSPTLSVGVFRYLDPRWVDPNDGWFSQPLLREVLSALRRDLRTNPASLALGSLAAFVPADAANCR